MPARKVKRLKRGPTKVTRKKPPKSDGKPVQDTPPKRPTQYTPQLGERLLERMANGVTATEICRDPTMPTWGVLKRWERDYPDFGRRYETARRQCCEYMTDEIITIADNAANDYIQRSTGGLVFNREGFERSRLRIDSRKWTASKVLRHVYGDKSEVDLRTPDGLNVKVEERNALIDALCKLVQPKVDGKTKPDVEDETRER